MLSDCFISFVSKDCRDDELMARSRRQGDIEKLFPDAKVTRYTKSDYLFRAAVKKADVKAALCAEVDRIVYNNFKASVRDAKLHNAYNRVWSVMADLQPLVPYSGNRASNLDSDWWRDSDDALDTTPLKGKLNFNIQRRHLPDQLQIGFDSSPSRSGIAKKNKKKPGKSTTNGRAS